MLRRLLRRVLLPSAMLASSVMSCAQAHAQPENGTEHPALEYSAAPPGCPTADDVSMRFAERLGSEPFTESSASRLILRIETTSRGISGTIRLVDGTGQTMRERRLTPRTRSCSSLVDGLVTVGSVWLDSDEPPSGVQEGPTGTTPPGTTAEPHETASTPDPATALPETTPPAPTPLEQADSEPSVDSHHEVAQTSTEAPRDVGTGLRASLASTFGGLTSPTLRSTIGFERTWNRFSFGIEALFERRPSRDAMHLLRFGMAAPACWVHAWLRLCSGVEVQLIRSSVAGANPSSDRVAFPVLAFARVEAGFHRRRHQLGVVLEPALAVVRGAVAVDGAPNQDRWWALRLGFAWRFTQSAHSGANSN